MIDVASSERIPRKAGPGITKGDSLVINKNDLAPPVGPLLDVVRNDVECMHGGRPLVMTNLKTGAGVDQVIGSIVRRGLLVASPPPLLTRGVRPEQTVRASIDLT